jgi:hypothetical protein
MFRLNLPQLFSVQKISKLFGFRHAEPVKEEAVQHPVRVSNPWQDDLDKLVQDRFLRGTQQPEEIEECIAKMTDTCTQMKEYSKAQILEEEKQRRLKATRDTVHDLKAWWGDALSAWEPAAHKDNPEQKSRQRAIQRWFYK